jgi:hypothetical protein
MRMPTNIGPNGKKVQIYTIGKNPIYYRAGNYPDITEREKPSSAAPASLSGFSRRRFLRGSLALFYSQSLGVLKSRIV